MKELIEEQENKPLYYSKKEPRKSLSTYFRNQNKFMVGSLAIADRKAMIMIRINSTIVSALVVFHDYIVQNVEMPNVISLVLLLGCSTSLICSVLTAKPNGASIDRIFSKIIKQYPRLSSNNFFLMDDVSLEEYEKSMDEVVQNQELQIGNQVRVAYALNRYLGMKYRLLDLAYNVFLASFVAVALLFLYSRLS